jgi:aminoglycoside phosphotransferase (APT) family kinase protein
MVTPPDDALAGRLRARLGTVLGGGGVEISDLRRLTGGASRETWAFTAAPDDGSAPRRLVLRRDPPGEERPEAMRLEATVIAAAARNGVPVPALVDHGDGAATLGTPYLITDHVDGETIPRRLLREPEYAGALTSLAAECGRVLARIHAISPDAVAGLPAPDPLDLLIEMCSEVGVPIPAVELALHWLRSHRPDAVSDALVHGDFRNGNLIVAPDGLRAVLDWEQVHLGDPREDLGWLCVKAWRFGAPLPVGGFGTREQLLDGYAEVAGARPDPAAVHWWEVHRTAWWAIGCHRQAHRHLSWQTRSVELAAIGRRAAEQEHDLLVLLGVPAVPVAAGHVSAETRSGSNSDIEPGSAPDLYGRPSAVDLIEAVREFLDGEVMPAFEGRMNFMVRVARGALQTVERELRAGPEPERRHRTRLGELGLGFDDDAGLAAALRDGTADPQAPAIVAAVRASVTDRLLVANPRYLSQG